MRRAKDNGYPIELLIAESCRLSCELLATALCRYRSRLSVIACATDSSQIFKLYATKKADVCIVSSNLKDGTLCGLSATRELRAIHPDARVLMLIDSPEGGAVVEAFRAGALGVFPRDGSFNDLYKCIQKVHSGQIWANSEQVQYLVESLVEKAPSPIMDAKGNHLLTQREQSLVDLVAQGRTNRDISQELKLSEHTVRNYLFRIFNKLGTSNRLELALYAINHRDADKEQLVSQD